MELTKRDTKMLQGLSVLAMVCLHLFDRYDYDGLFEPLVFLWGYPLSFYFGQLCDFCVMGFAFCSGYAHLAMYRMMTPGEYHRASWKRVMTLYCNYWIILNTFTFVSIVTGQSSHMPGSFWTYLGHVLGVLHTYNESWWYLFTYVILVISSPAILRWILNQHSFTILSVSLLVYVMAFLVRYKTGWDTWLAMQAGKLGMTFFEYVIGAVFCAENVFTKLRSCQHRINKKIDTAGSAVIWLLIFGGLLLGRTLIVPNMIAAPFSGLVILVGFVLIKKPLWLERLFLLLGKHSTNIWLTHLFFYAVIFKDFVYIAKYPILIILFMMMITLGLSSAINALMSPIQKAMSKAK